MLFKRSSILVTVLFITYFSYAQNIKQDKLSVLSQEELIKIVLKEINVKESNTDFVTATVSPNNSSETIIVIPEVVNKEEDIYELNSYIVIVNNRTGNISHKFFESSKETGWFSDAIYISDISIDAENYKISPTQNAFGIIIQYTGSSQPNPYSRKDISLYTKHNTTLRKVLGSYTIYEESGEVDVSADTCYSDIHKIVAKLSTTNSVTNGYLDILSISANSQMVSFKNKNEDCDVKEKPVSLKKELLRFNGTKYQK